MEFQEHFKMTDDFDLFCRRFSSSSFHFPSRARPENPIRKNFMFTCLIYIWEYTRASETDLTIMELKYLDLMLSVAS